MPNLAETLALTLTLTLRGAGEREWPHGGGAAAARHSSEVGELPVPEATNFGQDRNTVRPDAGEPGSSHTERVRQLREAAARRWHAWCRGSRILYLESNALSQ